MRAARVTLFPSATFAFYLAAPTVSNPQSTCNQRDVLILQPLPVALPRVLLFSTSVLYSSLIKNKSHTQHTTTAAVELQNKELPWNTWMSFLFPLKPLNPKSRGGKKPQANQRLRGKSTQQIFFDALDADVAQVERSRRGCPLQLKLRR